MSATVQLSTSTLKPYYEPSDRKPQIVISVSLPAQQETPCVTTSHHCRNKAFAHAFPSLLRLLTKLGASP